MIIPLKKLVLLIVAEKRFAENGCFHTTIREVAALARTNSFMISYYFGSKQNLLLGIIALRAKTFENLIAISKVMRRSPLDTLLLLSELIVKKVFHESSFHRLLIQLYSIGDQGVVLEFLYNIKQKNQLYISDLLQAGIDSGRFLADADPESVVGVITSVANNYLLHLHYLKWKSGKLCSERAFISEMVRKAVAEVLLILKVLAFRNVNTDCL